MIFLLCAIVTCLPFLFPLHSVSAALATHIVISEVQVAGTTTDDEFIELYNPTDTNVDISTWSIQNENISGTFYKRNLPASAVIPAHGFYLIARSTYYDGTVTPDLSQGSFSLSGTGTTIFLVNDQTILTTGVEGSIIDRVAIGSSALDSETLPYSTVPGTNSSIERKATSTSDETSMIGGGDASLGNGEDTDDNSTDFIYRTESGPQNSQSTPETFSGQTPPAVPEFGFLTGILTLTASLGSYKFFKLKHQRQTD